MRAFASALCALDDESPCCPLAGCALRTVVFSDFEYEVTRLLPNSDAEWIDLSGSHLSGDDLDFVFEMLRAGGAPRLSYLDLSSGDLEPQIVPVIERHLREGSGAPQLAALNVLNAPMPGDDSWPLPLVERLVAAAEARALSLCGPIGEGPTSQQLEQLVAALTDAFGDQPTRLAEAGNRALIKSALRLMKSPDPSSPHCSVGGRGGTAVGRERKGLTGVQGCSDGTAIDGLIERLILAMDEADVTACGAASGVPKASDG